MSTGDNSTTSIVTEGRGPTTRTVYSERTVRLYSVFESELTAITRASSRLTIFTSMSTLTGSGLLACVIAGLTSFDLTETETLLLWFIGFSMAVACIASGYFAFQAQREQSAQIAQIRGDSTIHDEDNAAAT